MVSKGNQLVPEVSLYCKIYPFDPSTDVHLRCADLVVIVLVTNPDTALHEAMVVNETWDVALLSVVQIVFTLQS